ncbi:MAG: GTP-binding protein [Clostridia bacterium]|nr:GTP-binding protein [Clostridia bacterium]
MTKIDIISGFLGAGKTTLLKKLIKEAYAGEKLVLIENEFGEIGIDGGFMQDAGIEVTEMNSGCICCSLVGDFGKALEKVLKEFSPDRILIEPSGVGKLSDVIRAVEGVTGEGAALNCFTTVVDVNKCKMYMKNFGEFFNDQVKNAGCIVLSHTGKCSDEKIAAVVGMLRTENETATIVTTDWDSLTGAQLLLAMERQNTLSDELKKLEEEAHHHHEHHHHEHGEECCCGHHHGEEHEHHHHHDEHHHEHGENCTCGCHDHDHHHHHADEVFTSWGVETSKKFAKGEIDKILDTLSEGDAYGMILRAKGIVQCEDGSWIHFDYVPGEPNVRTGCADVIGRLCVIGAKIDKAGLSVLFGVN